MERRRLPKRPLIHMAAGTQLKLLGRDRGNVPGPGDGRIPVTIKYVPIEKRQNFDAEVDALLSLQHPNILNLVACSDKDTSLLLLLDYADMGSLENYLRDDGSMIQLDQQLWFCRELAQGLAFVARANIVHRALTPSRIRVHAGSHYYASLKIADFEYARDIGDRESYIVAPDMPGVHFPCGADQVPVEWFAPECLSRVAPKFSVGSDVWAYAVTCWVIFSNGVLPTPEMRANRTPPTSWLLNAVANDFLRCPHACSMEWYRILTRCWATKPDHRPNPEYICEQLTKLLEDSQSGRTELRAYEELDTIGDIQGGLARTTLDDEQEDTMSATTAHSQALKNVFIHLTAITSVARDPCRDSCFKLVPKQQAPTITLSTTPSPAALTQDQREAVSMWVDAISRAIHLGSSNSMAQISVAQHPSVNAGVRPYKLARVPELASLVRYCQVVKVFHSPTSEMDRKPYQMSSLTESQALSQFKSHMPLIDYHTMCLNRVYPNIWKIRSENFNPVPYWNYGFQMTSLNFQTPGRDLQVNQGRFRCNGRSGYVLKPIFLRTRQFFNPKQPTAAPVTSPKEITFTVLAGRHLGCQSVWPVVEIEILGVDCDTAKKRTTEQKNGLAPKWRKEITFVVNIPELALVRFSVLSLGMGFNTVLAESVVPVNSLRQGIRRVQMVTPYGEDMDMAMLLVNVDIRANNNYR